MTPTGDGPLRFPPPVRVAAQAAVLLPGVLVAVEAGYLAVLALAALVEPQLPVRTAPPRARLCVLVPAKDEERLIGRCVSSLRAQDYPPERYEVLVVADDCSDRTAERAASSGARVLERRDASRQGKGHALRWAMDHVLADGADVDAFVVVDADSVADPGMLTALGARFEAGAAAVQGEYLVLDAEQDPRAPLRAAAFLLFHLVRFRGRAALGLPCSLVGNGMLLSRELVEQHPWKAFSITEDLEHTLVLRLAGVRPEFARDARLRAPVASRGVEARTQRARWEGGRLVLARAFLPRLARAVAGGRRDLWDVVVDLAVPPLGVLAVGAAGGTGATLGLVRAGLVPRWSLAPWLVGVVGLHTYVLVGLRAADAPVSTYVALRHAPLLVASELSVRLRLLAGRVPASWERPRPDSGPGGAAPPPSGASRPPEPPVADPPSKLRAGVGPAVSADDQRTTGRGRAGARFSVVIPAKDEATVIGRCLAFVGDLEPGEAEVVVVPNGCRDDTAERAAQVPGVTVVDVPAPGKAGALNAGDEVTTALPRIYLDADIVVSADTLRRLCTALEQDPAPAMAAPRPQFATRGRPRLVRHFFDVYERLPYVASQGGSAGVYALNAAGRARFSSFPALTADDLYVQRLFGAGEVRVPTGAVSEVQAPRTVTGLVKIRTRVASGNAELAGTGLPSAGRSGGSTALALLRLLTRQPGLLPAAVSYTGVTAMSRVRAKRAGSQWQTDTSTR